MVVAVRRRLQSYYATLQLLKFLDAHFQDNKQSGKDRLFSSQQEAHWILNL